MCRTAESDNRGPSRDPGRHPHRYHQRPPQKPIKFQLDETSTPKVWETHGVRGITRAIYKVEGDTLTICYPFKPEHPTPTKFESNPGGNTILCVFKRHAK